MKYTNILLAKLPHKHSRPPHGGTEIRTYNLEQSRAEAQKIIDSEKLPLTIGNIDIRVRSFVVYENEAEVQSK